jgi:hypothetical protein
VLANPFGRKKKMAPLWPLRLLSSSSRVCLPSSFLLHRACSLRPRVGRDVLLRCFCTADQQKKQKKKLVFLGTPEVPFLLLSVLPRIPFPLAASNGFRLIEASGQLFLAHGLIVSLIIFLWHLCRLLQTC